MYHSTITQNIGNKAVVVIAGGGPAGLTLAYELSRRSATLHPVVCEASDMLGGISRTVCHHGNRIDLGGHRFFSKDARVLKFWADLMPTQQAPALDQILLGEGASASQCNAPDPERDDRIMLLRRRISRIFYSHRFIDYPVSLSFQTLRAIGLWQSIKVFAGFLASRLHRRPERSLEDFYINRFGKPLYRLFFEDYTAKVWGYHPSELAADWGAQRVRELSLFGIIKDMLLKKLALKSRTKVATSLIEQFLYPKLGPGQLWETTARLAQEQGAKVETNTKVCHIDVDTDYRVKSVEIRNSSGELRQIPCDWFVSSMPLCDLISAIRGIEVPASVKRIARHLPYRDFIMAGLLLPKLRIKNNTKLKTLRERIPDTWIYVQDPQVKLGRVQIFNNWSPYMVKDFENTVWIGLEYFCTKGDTLWNMPESDFIAMAIAECQELGIINSEDVLDSVQIKVEKAYPAYHGSYYQLDEVRAFLNKIPNLFCIGRNGQHRYNNMDHSMLTAMKAADAIIAQSPDKDEIWNVNTEQEYLEDENK